jgi:hypothetical protein
VPPPSERCPCCRKVLLSAALKAGICSRCHAVVGEANQCALCHAFIATIQRGNGHFCGACGSERRSEPGTVCASDRELLQALEPRPFHGLFAAVCACASLPIVAGAWVWSGSPLWGRALPILGLVIAALGSLMIHRLKVLTRRRRSFEIEQRIIGLAYQNDGVLRAREVSTRLRITLAEARLLLGSLANQGRAAAQALGNEEPEFRFGEARRTRGIRARSSRLSTPPA